MRAGNLEFDIPTDDDLSLPEIAYGVPARINQQLGKWYIWECRVSQTGRQKYSDRYPHYLTDQSGSSFGVGDTILYNPKLRDSRSRKKPVEGIVIELHQYIKDWSGYGRSLHPDDERTYGVKADFGQPLGQKFFPSQDLLALTNDQVVFKDLEKFSKMKNVPFRDFDKVGQEIKKIYEDSVARAIWMSYRLHHISDNGDIVRLNRSALRLSEELQKNPLPRNRLALWFRRNMRPEISEDLALHMVPFLAGEKIATFVPK